jgi:hypothetical protein
MEGRLNLREALLIGSIPEIVNYIGICALYNQINYYVSMHDRSRVLEVVVRNLHRQHHSTPYARSPTYCADKHSQFVSFGFTKTLIKSPPYVARPRAVVLRHGSISFQ